MNKTKQKRLLAKGWKAGHTKDFLNLSDDEVSFIDIKLALSKNLKLKRQKSKLSQTDLAKLIKSSQSRIAKMESGDPSVSVDLLVKSLLALGASKKDLTKAISTS